MAVRDLRADDPLARGPPAALSGRRAMSDDFLEGRIRALKSENAALEARAEKAEADLAAARREIMRGNHPLVCPECGPIVSCANCGFVLVQRAAGRESGGTKPGASPAGNTAPSRGLGDRGQPSGLGQKSAAAKSAARLHPETEDGCGA